ncbi:MAG: putative selenate reductase subunit YgfK [Bacteroidales bacterium]
MTERFSIIPFRQLTEIVFRQVDSGHFFGIPENVFFKPSKNDPFRLNRFGQTLESPVGVAAGPHTQLAQNIIAAWLTGARYMELKTVQTLDELDVAKPCIDMQDEGYNCEWSQELKIHESFDQYLNAWILIHVLKHRFGRDDEKELGTIFNMSVGYDLHGILKKNIQWFFDKMKNSKSEKDQKIKEIEELYPSIRDLVIPDCISDNVTLSTMHGCPPEEIEKIGLYLIEEKKLHTIIKLNPTLLGKEKLHKILDNSGFETIVPDEAFEHDLKYNDALPIIKNLRKSAIKNNLHVGLKLTNTLESVNHKSVFPKSEKMMYMSGKALHPISIQLAKKLQKEFIGELDISFSGGVNAFNIHSVVSCGLVPATVCSDILKPGGYGLIKQYLENLRIEMDRLKSDSIGSYILKSSKEQDEKMAILKNLESYSFEVTQNANYKKTGFHEPSIKTSAELKYFDCIHAPCVETCPTNQDIPDYMFYTAAHDIPNAFATILRRNPFPNTTGMVCDHLCQTKCTRMNYDDAVLIREIKRFIAENEAGSNLQRVIKPNGLKAAVIGAGPSGLSGAYFLALGGFEVEVFETKDHPGGMVSGAIPAFRLTDEAFYKDIRRIEDLGVKIHYNSEINKNTFEKIRNDHQYLYIAVGAQQARKFIIDGIHSEGVLDPLHFLFDVKNGIKTSIGKNVTIIGGGNTAMDAARTAYRLVGKNGKVTILYRRTIKQMPADIGEIKAVLEEGMEILELTLPIKVNTKDGHVVSLTCIRMKLDDGDPSGRPRPIEIEGSEFDLEFDTVIPAIGQDLDIDFMDHTLLKSEPGIYETKIPNVFIGGDALRGASTAINAIADGRKAAEKIMSKAQIIHSIKLPDARPQSDFNTLMTKRMIKVHSVHIQETSLAKRKNFDLVSGSLEANEALHEAARCLLCDELCNTCVTVCPNLALFPYTIDPVNYNLQKIKNIQGRTQIVEDVVFRVNQKPQILHIADWCNECGNCTTFCPTADAPYKVKPHLYLNLDAFENDDDCYFFNLEENKTVLLYRKDGQLLYLKENESAYQFTNSQTKIELSKQDFSVLNFEIGNDCHEINLRKAAEMSVILEGVKGLLSK